LILWSLVLALGAYAVVQYFYHNSILAILAAAGGLLGPLAFVAFKRSRRLRAFEKNFPEAIDLLSRAVRAGHSFTTGLEMIATELPEPVAGEFRTAFEEQNFGLPLRDALLNLSERVPLIDVRFFVTALLIQKETGGNLAEILDNLSHVVRDRFRILGEVRIKTAQGRLTAGILMALPPFMVVMMRFLNPDYVNQLFTDPWGPYMLGGGAILQVIGSIMLWKIVNIEV
jgi:tight adherence protein B